MPLPKRASRLPVRQPIQATRQAKLHEPTASRESSLVVPPISPGPGGSPGWWGQDTTPHDSSAMVIFGWFRADLLLDHRVILGLRRLHLLGGALLLQVL